MRQAYATGKINQISIRFARTSYPVAPVTNRLLVYTRTLTLESRQPTSFQSTSRNSDLGSQRFPHTETVTHSNPSIQLPSLLSNRSQKSSVAVRTDCHPTCRGLCKRKRKQGPPHIDGKFPISTADPRYYTVSAGPPPYTVQLNGDLPTLAPTSLYAGRPGHTGLG